MTAISSPYGDTSDNLQNLGAISASHSYGTWEFEAFGPACAYPEDDVAELRVLVTVDGEPCARLRLPHPGPGAGEAYLSATVRRTTRQVLDQRVALDRLRARLDSRPRLDPPRLSRSVIVCTHRRRDDVATLLAALQALDPAPEEIIIVDNAPGNDDCREMVEAAGGIYVREDRIGLDRARRAGLMAATGDLVCFTDDDCAPAVHWLRRLPELFADPSVGAVTGPAFASELATKPQVRFEDSSGFDRGLRQRTFDWRTISPLRASGTGAGANMTFRRSLLLTLGDVFPVELDAGTPAQSGGDMVALYRVLAAGARIRYDPSTYVLHRHRREARLLHDGVWGYGVGLSAALTKLLVRDHEFGAIPAWTWLWQQYRAAVIGRVLGRIDRVEQRIAWDYLRGGLVGPRTWWRTRAFEEPPPWSSSQGEPEIVAGGVVATRPRADPRATAATPAVSVIIATCDRPAALSRCLEALGRQRSLHEDFETIVVDDSRLSPAAVPEGLAPAIRTVRSGGAGAASARNQGVREARGRYVLFLDDDLVPAPDLLARHLERHRREDAEAIVIGVCPPAPVDPTLAALNGALWWTDHYRAKADAPALMFVDVLSGNTSMPKGLFERLGGFDDEFAAHRREDYDFGVRALRAGARAVHAPDAVARHEFRLTTRGAIAASSREGSGDALLVARWPEVVSTLPPTVDAPRGLSPRAIRALLEDRFGRKVFPLALDGLELLRARDLWLRIFYRALGAAYQRARREMASQIEAPMAGRPEMLTIELADDGPIASPPVAAPLIRVCWRGRRLGIVRPLDGQWSPTELARQMIEIGDPDVWAGMASGMHLDPHADTPAVESTLETLQAPPWGDAGAWRAIDSRLCRSGATAVVLSLGARPGLALPPGALDVLASPRVGLVFGGRSGESVLGPANVFSRGMPYEGRGLPCAGVEYLAVRPEVLRSIGGLGGSTVRWGADAITGDLFERVLSAGHHAAKQNLPGAAPPTNRFERTWTRERAAGASAVQRLAAAGGLGAAPQALRLVPLSRRPLSLGFRWVAFAAGGLGGLRDLRARRGPRDGDGDVRRPAAEICSPLLPHAPRCC